MDEKNKLVINIVIEGRNYPIRIDREDDSQREWLIRNAAAEVNSFLLEQKQKGYKNKDEQDYLSMALIKYAVRVAELENNNFKIAIINELKQINFELEDFLESAKTEK